MDFEELKKETVKFIKENPQYKEKAVEELKYAQYCFEEKKFDFIKYLKDLKEKNDLSEIYVLPFVLGLTDKIIDDDQIEVRQILPGDGGGLDIDTDISTEGKPRVKKYLEEKYGKDYISSVGTYTTLGMSSAIKDILRKEGVSFKDSNAFCKELDTELSFEENMNIYKEKFPELYKIYDQYQTKLDFVPKMSNIIRSVGQHAGGVMILNKPIYELTPVIRTKDGLATAFVENGGATVLDSLGLTKYDMLGISTLDIINDTINLINEKLYEIEEDGVIKIVPESYILSNYPESMPSL